MNKVAQTPYTFFYCLEPGDGTRYTFSIAHLNESATHVISGIKPDEYICLAIHMPSVRGSYEMSISALRNADANTVDYYRGHAGQQVDRYTCAAVILAASILVRNPFAADRAAEEMLKVPQLLGER